MLQLKNEIYNFKQLHSEVLYMKWLRLKNKLQNAPNHRITEKSLIEIFYIAFNANTKALTDTITRGFFMSLRYEHDLEMLYHITKNN